MLQLSKLGSINLLIYPLIYSPLHFPLEHTSVEVGGVVPILVKLVKEPTELVLPDE